MRGQLAPWSVPLARTRSESFDLLVMDAVGHLGPQVGQRLGDVEFAVEDVPDPIGPADSPDDVLEDNGVPLSRIHRRGLSGVTGGPLIVFYRRPMESRAPHPGAVADVVHDVVVMQIARYLGESPEDIDPPGQ